MIGGGGPEGGTKSSTTPLSGTGLVVDMANEAKTDYSSRKWGRRILMQLEASLESGGLVIVHNDLTSLCVRAR